MIVEDEMIVRAGIRMTVDWAALDLELVLEAGNGAAAWESYREQRPDIIITDLKMPVMDGMTLIQKIREFDQDTRIIILSNLEEFNMIRQAITLNVSDYMLKLTMTKEDIHRVLGKVKQEIQLIEKSRVTRHAGSGERECGQAILAHLLYRQYTTAELNARLAELPRPFTLDRVMMAALEIENYEQVQDVFDDRYGDLVYTAFFNVISELLAEEGRGIVLHLKDSSYLLIMDAGKMPDRAAEESFLTCLSNVNQVLYSHFNSCITFGVSELSREGRGLRELLAQAQEAVQASFYLGTGDSLLWRDVERLDIPALLRKKLRAMAEEAGLGEADRRLLEDGLNDLDRDAGREAVLSLLLYLVSAAVNRVVAEPRKRYNLTKSFEAQLTACRTVDEMTRVFLRACATMDGSDSEAEWMNATILRVLNYIEKHYHESLTLEGIADSVSISKNYLCSLFKKEMGINLIRYLMVFRIEKAKALLLETGLKSYEIAEQIGFSGESYFSRSFKKVTGRSPAEYRQEAFSGGARDPVAR